MKRFLLCLALGVTSLSARAQAPVGSRALTRAESRQGWPEFVRETNVDYPFQVKALQFLLRNIGFYRSAPDGVFGPATGRAVKAFQRDRRLKADGVVGAQTWVKLCPRLRRGDRGDAVRAFQFLLNADTNQSGEPRYGRLALDGSFGFSTESALRKYQRDYGFKGDGVVGARTWASLLTPKDEDVP